MMTYSSAPTPVRLQASTTLPSPPTLSHPGIVQVMSFIGNKTTFPPEVWAQVLNLIPQPQLAGLLGVCSQFHDIVIGRVFSAIKVYFIDGERAQQMLNTKHHKWIDDIAQKLMCKSWEILNHICQDRRFARVVKSITVVAFSDGLSIFERMTVANTISFVPNLHTFRWIGNGPAFDSIVAECLPANLKRLSIQSSFPVGSLQHLTNIEHLELPIPFFFPDDEEAHDRVVFDDELMDISSALPIEDILNAFPSELHSLRLCAAYIQNVPVRICNTLTELDILVTIGDIQELVGLDAVFRHATALQSLSVVGFIDPIFFSFLANASEAMPLLSSFRLSLEERHFFPEGEFLALIGFLKNRPLLRRLYIRIPGIGQAQIPRLLWTIKELEGLEVLGLHAGRLLLSSSEAVEMLAQGLPSNLCALHLALNWGDLSLLPLIDAIVKIPHLSFLHLYGVIVRLPVLLEDLAFEAKGLQMIGLNRALWTINRVGPGIETDKYPRWKIKFAIEEDFLCEDDAWLFKYN